MKNKFLLLLFLLAACGLALSACGQKDDPGVTTLIYARLSPHTQTKQAVDKFNVTHTDVKIEVRDYFDEKGLPAKERLFAEFAVGKIPDIIDLGDGNILPYATMARKDYLEDLWPFIENDPDLGREGIWETPLKAAEVNGGLYMIFRGVSIRTAVGAESVVGNRYSWNLEDLTAAFDTMPAGSTIFDFLRTKEDMFKAVFAMSINDYVDWDTGECGFTSEKFKTALQLVENCPNNADAYALWDEEALHTELAEYFLDGYQMLLEWWLSKPQEIQLLDAYFSKGFGKGERTSFIGFPTEDGSVGSSFKINNSALAMSATCKNKETAWEFMRTVLLPRYKKWDDKKLQDSYYIPVNRADYDLLIEMSRRSEGRTLRYANGPDVRFKRSTKEEIARFEYFINSVEKIDLYDRTLYNIAWEQAGAYFAGHRSLDDTAEQIQNRARLYVNEQR